MGNLLKNNDIDLTEVKSGKKIECLTCHDGYYVTDCKDVSKAHLFYCNKCGERLMLETSIDLRNIL